MDTLQLNELLECSVCLERLGHNCKVLPCQHTFCVRCLKQIVASRKELRCPECRVLVTEDVDDLPTNILLVRILEGLKRQKEIKSKETEQSQCNNSIKKDTEEKPTSSTYREPCARALYDYDPKEQGDLVLKKGQSIELVRQVDANWYEGRIDGQQGFLPANYIEVLIPLPSFDDSVNQGPVARALYDFEDPEEKDLLSFRQGEIMQVIRRVDENWCEGRIDNVYGIFPINFVEFNDAARSIIFSRDSDVFSSGVQWDQAVQVRPTRRPKAVREVKRHTVHGGERQQIPKENGNMPNRHSIDVTCSERFDSYCSDELVSSQHVNGNSDESEELASRCGYDPGTQDDDLRMTRLNHSRQSSRESPPSSSHSRQNSDEPVLESSHSHQSSEEDRSGTRSNSNKQNGSEERTNSSSSNKQVSSDQTSPPLRSRHSSSSDAGSELYIALYNYKSQKDDEIDLVQGEKYQVIEKCRDGWFKGRSIKSRKSGVFPGNYVKMSSHADVPGMTQQANTSTIVPVTARSSSVPSCRQSVPTPAPSSSAVLSDVSCTIVAPNERINPQYHPPPPPATRPTATSSGSFFSKFSMGKKKERGRPLISPPPPYRRHPPSSYRRDGPNVSLFGPSPSSPPPPYSPRSTAGQPSRMQSTRPSRLPSSQQRERCRVVVAYPPQSGSELELRVGDIVYVFKKHEDGWYMGTLERNGKTGLFPGSFVEKF